MTQSVSNDALWENLSEMETSETQQEAEKTCFNFKFNENNRRKSKAL